MTFVLANISMKVVLGMLFLTLGNTDVQFAEKKLIWRTYTTKKALSTTCWVELLDQKQFVKMALDENIKAFVVHVIFLKSKITIYSAKEAQMALLLAEKVTVLAKNLDFANVFLKKLANILFKQTGANSI